MRINHGVPVKNRHECSFHQPVPCTHPTARGAPARPLVDFGGQITVLSGPEPSLSLQPSPGPFWSEEADVKKSTALVCLVGLHKGLCRCWRWEGFFGCVRRHFANPFCSPAPLRGPWEAYLLCRGAAHRHYETQPVKSFSFLLGDCPAAQDMEKLRDASDPALRTQDVSAVSKDIFQGLSLLCCW